MKMIYTHITILAYFPTDTLNCQVLWRKQKYFLNGFVWKIEK